MKKIRIIFILLFILILCSAPLYAANSTFDFKTTNNNLKSGDTFKATLIITSDTILNATQFSIGLDSDIFECEKIYLEDTANFAMFSNTTDMVEILTVSGTENPLVVNLDLKVKDTNRSGNFNITVNDLKIDYVEETDVFAYSVPSLNLKVNSNNIFSLTNPFLYIGIVLIAIVFVVIVLLIKKSKK